LEFPPSPDQLRRIAQERFDFDSLRSGQFEAVEAVVAGRDTLCVMPTGSGKSAIYQLSGLIVPGLTVVVSPLIALQQDQVASIAGLDIGAAAEVNSSLGDSQRKAVFDALNQGSIEFLFMAPEQFANDETQERLTRCTPSLLVIDEAHCVSQWGHDFRPEYLRIGETVDALGHPTVLALTATASAPVRNEIVDRLHMSEPAVIVQGFDRPNIHLSVETFEDAETKFAALIDAVERAERPGIVYAATRNDTEAIAAALVERGIEAAAYHAGRKATDRGRTHEQFRDDDIDVVVATIAFGMGVDKPNVRFVFHHDVSDSLDSYYQEIGRAGRDGEPADATLFYLPEDLNLRRFQNGAGQLAVDEVEPVIRALARTKGPVDARVLRTNFDIADTRLMRILNRLADIDVIDLDPAGQIDVYREDLDPESAARAAVDEQQRHQHIVQSRLEMMRRYAELGDCRRRFLLNYFGEAIDSGCGRCDRCDEGRGNPEPPANQPFAIDARVRHATFGHGTVMHYEGDRIVVLFDTDGYRTLSVDLVLDDGLLEAAPA